MPKEFNQIDFDDALLKDWQRLLEIAVEEDMPGGVDLTTDSLVGDVDARAAVVARTSCCAAGLPLVPATLKQIDLRLAWKAEVEDGTQVAAGGCVGVLQGPACAMLKAERLLLNLLGRMFGIASLTAEYVEKVRGTNARIYDTRKTTPGWRRLEKYAVRQGGGCNHRTGLFEAVLIKDNHLAFGTQIEGKQSYTPAEAVDRARAHVFETLTREKAEQTIIEIEVDTLDQLDEVLPVGPDIVLLDNMTTDQLREAVARRDKADPSVQLEASGGVNLTTVAGIAQTGVDRISVGALTHSAVCADLGLDWL